MSYAKNSSSTKKCRKLGLFFPNSDLKQFGQAHRHMTDKSLVVQTLLDFFFFLVNKRSRLEKQGRLRQILRIPKKEEKLKWSGRGKELLDVSLGSFLIKKKILCTNTKNSITKTKFLKKQNKTPQNLVRSSTFLWQDPAVESRAGTSGKLPPRARAGFGPRSWGCPPEDAVQEPQKGATTRGCAPRKWHLRSTLAEAPLKCFRHSGQRTCVLRLF